MATLASAPILDRADRVMTVAWRTRPWGWLLLAAGGAGLVVALAVRAADGEPWTVADVVGDVLVPLAVGYLGLVLLRDHTQVRLQPGGAIRIRTVPFPFLPAGRIGAGELAHLEVSRARPRRLPVRSWRIELVTRAQARHPLCFGGIDSAALAESTAASVREFLRLPAPPGEGPGAS